MHVNFLSLTLQGESPVIKQGETSTLCWQWLAEGILALWPKAVYRQAVVLSAGLHGNETAPVEMLNQLVTELLSGQRPLAVRLLVIFGNIPALQAGKRYLHTDINRMFGGRYRQFAASGETARARQLEQLVTAFFAADAPDSGVVRYHYDLHTAIRDSVLPRFGLLPFQSHPYDATLLAWLDAADLDALVFHRAPGGTFSHFSSECCQAASCTLELGKARPFGTNDLRHFADINRMLQAFISGDTRPVRRQTAMHLFCVVHTIIKHNEIFRLHLSDDTPNFTCLTQGMLLAEQPGETYRVQHEQEWILFPNPQVATGMRAGLLLTETTPEALSMV
ncbi:succinylglutamate desuccinylase [Brenneria uluponensis]|uniref:succinylglutamate desuccinylase n=1 Tax=Brenneria uluponensis TaxID=3057057 RepID=UPI0028EDEBCC|nr:succinylglutamate desuccinylase [Brenneria ulupoensis]